MNSNNPQLLLEPPQRQNDDINLQEIVGKGLKYWWLFLSFITISIITASLYLRYSPAKYKVMAKILVKDANKGAGAPGMQMFEELGLLGGQSSVDNEVELLKSRTLMENTVSALQLNARYFAHGRIRQSEIFASDIPFVLTVLDLKKDSISSDTRLTFSKINERQFRLKYNETERTEMFGDTIAFNFGRILFNYTNSKASEENVPISIFINRPDNTVADFQEKLNVAITSKTASTIDLILEDVVPVRGERLLNTLIRIYNQMNTEDKNRVADSTITFIDNRLVFVTRELGDVERNIEQFRQRNELTNLSEQGKLLLENSSDYFKELSKVEVQISIINSLQNYLSDEQNTSRTVPAGLVIQDPTFASMVEKYNSLQLEKNRQLQTTTESNPVVQRLTVQIANLKTDIMATLATIKRSMGISQAQLKGRTNSFESQIREVPRKERAFLEISRQQAIKQELYLYLLKKREETAVSKAANIDNARIVDSAKSERQPFSPNRKTVYLYALVLGIAIPIIILYVRALLNNRIQSKKDITKVTDVPIVGEIGRSPNQNNLLVKDNPRHPIAEQFRLLRTNLEYMMPSASFSKVVMLTSSMTGEGKSFLSLNFASVLALGGKKVILLEFDLRKPKLSKYFGFNNNEGITSYLINKTSDLGVLTKSVDGVDGLFFLSSGPIPPNPAELISNKRTSELFSELRKQYDYVVIDAPPVGVVTDALLLSTYTDANLYVIRQNYTLKSQLELVVELSKQKKMSNMGIIVNDVKKQSGYGYSYSYGYGYS